MASKLGGVANKFREELHAFEILSTMPSEIKK